MQIKQSSPASIKMCQKGRRVSMVRRESKWKILNTWEATLPLTNMMLTSDWERRGMLLMNWTRYGNQTFQTTWKGLLSSSSGYSPFIWFSLLDLNNISGKENRRSIHQNATHCLKQIVEGPQTKNSTATSRQSVNRYSNKGNKGWDSQGIVGAVKKN